jgi:hypothetical protein
MAASLASTAMVFKGIDAAFSAQLLAKAKMAYT